MPDSRQIPSVLLEVEVILLGRSNPQGYDAIAIGSSSSIPRQVLISRMLGEYDADFVAREADSCIGKEQQG